jgi:hypothetical protein
MKGAQMQFPSGIKKILGLAVIGTVSLAGQNGAPPQAQNPSTQGSPAKDPNAAILDALKAIQGELHDIKTLLATRPTAALPRVLRQPCSNQSSLIFPTGHFAVTNLLL